MTLSFFAQTAEAEKTPSGGSIDAENSAVSSATPDFSVGAVLREQIALDEGVDYFSAQGALAAYRLGSIA